MNRPTTTKILALIANTLLLAAATFQASAQDTPLSTAFRYQGHLTESGAPLTGRVDLAFTLYDAVAGGNATSSTVVVDDVDVEDGLFSALVDLGESALLGEGRWLQVAVKSDNGFIFIPQTPRHLMTAVPHAVHALHGAGWTTSFQGRIDQNASGSDESAVPVLLSVGDVWEQTFRVGRSGPLTKIHILGADGIGPGNARVRASLKRGEEVIATTTRVLESQLPQYVNFDFSTLPIVFNGETLRCVLETTEDWAVFSISGIYGTDHYTPGELFGAATSFNYPDLNFMTYIGYGSSTTSKDVIINSGSLVINNGLSYGYSAIDFKRNDLPRFGMGIDPFNHFYVDVSGIGRVLSIPPGERKLGIGTTNPAQMLSVNGNTDISGRLSIGGGINPSAVLNVVGNGIFSGALSTHSLSTGAITASSLNTGSLTATGASTLQGSTTIGQFLSPNVSLTVRGRSVFDNTAAPAPEVALLVKHLNSGTGWPVRIENVNVPNFVGGMRIGSSGFFEMTNRADFVGGYARLDNSGNWTALSDARLKDNITQARGMLTIANALRPVWFTWKDPSSNSTGPHFGLLAQEVQAIMPDLVAQGEVLSVDYSRVGLVALGAAQELNQQVESLKMRVKAQDDVIQKLIKRIDDLTARDQK